MAVRKKKKLLVRAWGPLAYFAVIWLPCGRQKLLPTVFWHSETKSKLKKPKNNYLFLFTARTLTLWVRTLPCVPWPNEQNNFSSCRCAVAGSCRKMAALRLPKVASNSLLVFGHKTISEDTEKKKKIYLSLVAARTPNLWVRTMLSAPWRNAKNTFGLGRCAVVGFCRKMAPLRLPKVASHHFLAFGAKSTLQKSEKFYLLHLADQTGDTWIRTRPTVPWRGAEFKFGWCRCANVGFCCKRAPLRLPKVASNLFSVFGDKTTREKTENYYFLHIAAQALTPYILTMPSTT
jgi:hypothetical protein